MLDMWLMAALLFRHNNFLPVASCRQSFHMETRERVLWILLFKRFERCLRLRVTRRHFFVCGQISRLQGWI